MKRFFLLVLFFVNSAYGFSVWDFLNPLATGFWFALRSLGNHLLPLTEKDLKKTQQEMLTILNNRAHELQSTAITQIDTLFGAFKDEIETTIAPRITQLDEAVQRIQKDLPLLQSLCEKNVISRQQVATRRTLDLVTQSFRIIKEETRRNIKFINNCQDETIQHCNQKISLLEKSLEESLGTIEKTKKSLIAKMQSDHSKSIHTLHEKIKSIAQTMTNDHEAFIQVQGLIAEKEKDNYACIERLSNLLINYRRLIVDTQPTVSRGLSSRKLINTGSNHM